MRRLARPARAAKKSSRDCRFGEQKSSCPEQRFHAALIRALLQTCCSCMLSRGERPEASEVCCCWSFRRILFWSLERSGNPESRTIGPPKPAHRQGFGGRGPLSLDSGLERRRLFIFSCVFRALCTPELLTMVDLLVVRRLFSLPLANFPTVSQTFSFCLADFRRSIAGVRWCSWTCGTLLECPRTPPNKILGTLRQFYRSARF